MLVGVFCNQCFKRSKWCWRINLATNLSVSCPILQQVRKKYSCLSWQDLFTESSLCKKDQLAETESDPIRICMNYPPNVVLLHPSGNEPSVYDYHYDATGSSARSISLSSLCCTIGPPLLSIHLLLYYYESLYHCYVDKHKNHPSFHLIKWCGTTKRQLLSRISISVWKKRLLRSLLLVHHFLKKTYKGCRRTWGIRSTFPGYYYT